jgi:heptosyltransferase-2
MRKIAVFNTAFLGDAVLTLPLIRTLNKAWPGAELHFITRGGLAPLFKGQKELARLREFDKRGEHKGPLAALAFGREMNREKFDLWISAHLSLRSGTVALLSGAKRRIGYRQASLAPLIYTDTVDRRFQELEEVERLLALADPLGLKEKVSDPGFTPPPVALETAREFFENKVERPVLGVHPGSTWRTKKWPAAHFGEIIGRAAKCGASVIVFAGAGETADAAAAVAAAGELPSGRVHDLSGKLTLPELAAYIGMLDAYLSNDSGPMHLAWAQGVPVDAVFGPTTRDLGFFPRGEASTVHEIELPCRPCSLHGPEKCPKSHHDCMNKLSPEVVWESLGKKLEAARA